MQSNQNHSPSTVVLLLTNEKEKWYMNDKLVKALKGSSKYQLINLIMPLMPQLY